MMFEIASRKKLRFNSPSGLLSIEDLWDIPLTTKKGGTSLDDVAISLDKELRETSSVSFVNNTAKDTSLTKLKFDIVLRVIEVRKAEADAAETRRVNAEKKQKILAILDRKQEADLESKSVDELKELLKDT